MVTRTTELGKIGLVKCLEEIGIAKLSYIYEVTFTMMCRKNVLNKLDRVDHSRCNEKM